MGPPYGNEGEGEDADGNPLVLHVHHLRGVRLPHALNTHTQDINISPLTVLKVPSG